MTIRVLIVDDSPTARLLLKKIFTSDPDFEVVGTTYDGRQITQLVEELNPDLITMDLKMPQFSGVETIRKIMSESPKPVVIVSGSWESDDLILEMQGLEAGALAIVRKPQGVNESGLSSIHEELLTTARNMASVKVVRRTRWNSSSSRQRTLIDREESRKNTHDRLKQIRIIGLATSTGGPPALEKLLSQLPGDFPLPILAVQHMSRGFLRGMAEWLNSVTPLRVQMAEHQTIPQPGTVYFAPDDVHLGISRQQRIILSETEPLGGFRPAGTFLFRSLAESSPKESLGIILTGMGSDGAEGLLELYRAGGTVFAQDEASSVVHGMPGTAIQLGAVDEVFSLSELALQLLQLSRRETP